MFTVQTYIRAANSCNQAVAAAESHLSASRVTSSAANRLLAQPMPGLGAWLCASHPRRPQSRMHCLRNLSPASRGPEHPVPAEYGSVLDAWKHWDFRGSRAAR